MRLSNKPNIAAGISLLLIAAFFSISLILQPLDFGSIGPGRGNFLYFLGKMLVTVYGFSSILIPVFLFIASLSCFASRWTAKKSMRLLTALIPFFTCVSVEKILKVILSSSDDYIEIKLVFTIVIGLLLFVIEILAAGFIADSVDTFIYGQYKQESEENNFDIQEESVQDEVNQDSDENNIEELKEETVEQTQEQVPLSEREIENKAVFENVLDENKKLELEEEQKDPASMITQEEFKALNGITAENEQDEAEEIEWPSPEEIKNSAGIKEDTDSSEEIYNEEDEENPVDDVNSDDEYDSYNWNRDYDESENKEENSYTNENEEDVYKDSNYFQAVEPAIEDPYFAAETEQNLSNFLFEPEMNEETLDETEESPQKEKKTSLNFSSGIFDEMNEDARQEAEAFSDAESNTNLLQSLVNADKYENEIDSDFSQKDEVNELNKDEVLIGDDDDLHFDDDTSLADQNNDDSLESDEDYDNQTEDFEFSKEQTELNGNKSCIERTEKISNRVAPKKEYCIPTDLLTAFEDDKYWIIDEGTRQASFALKETLSEFSIDADVIGIKKGPVVTMFEILPAPGVKLSRIVSLQDNIALRLAASSVRIVAPIPGKTAVGIEVPNKKRSIVSFREMIEQNLPDFNEMAIPLVLGKDILGKAQLVDLVKTPHMLIAGATGAGKSVCVNSMILSILYKRSPQQVKLILIDPKIVELKLYNDIPHLLTPVITESKKAFQSLQYCLCEMERRYALLDSMGVRDISSYNRRIKERSICTEKLPYIVVIIDEFADLMATTGKELESIVARLTAMSRAVGIHLILATQRPSIDVITGLIKANIPTRIAFMVASKTDSRIIIDQVGAEMLLGKGDMLYASAVDPYPVRIQGTFISDNEVENVVDCVKMYDTPDYIDDEIFIDEDEDENPGPLLFSDGDDPLYEQALDIVIQAGKASASYIQRRLKIGYNRAARLVEEMEERGIVGPANGSKPREIIHIPN